jgi:hypothetical protein
MNGIIKFVKNIQIIRENSNPDLFAVKATGVAELQRMLAPVLVSSRNYENAPQDGVYELDFVLGATQDEMRRWKWKWMLSLSSRKYPNG